MDKTVPPGAALLLDFIGGVEAPKGYDTIYGNHQDDLPKPVTSMTLAEIQAAQARWTRTYGSSATGRYQFMRNTLRDLMTELGLRQTQLLDAGLQDRLGFHLLKRRGYDAFMTGSISRTEFGKRLAQEWASMPVLATTQGGSRTVSRGQSYYAGDGLNKSLVKPESLETALDAAKRAKPAPSPIISVEDLPKQAYPTPMDPPKGDDQSAMGNPIAEQNQQVKAMTKPSFWGSLFAVILSALKGKR